MAYKGKYTGAEVDNLLDKAGEIDEFQEVTAAAIAALNDKIEEQGDMNPDNYYTKSETDALIPDVSGYVTMSQVETKGYTTMGAVEAKGYITSASLDGYALSSDVYSKTDIDAKLGDVETILDLILAGN